MSAIVIGCGRSGTNVALEMLRGSPSLSASEPPEDKTFFQRDDEIPTNYLTKCDTCYFTKGEFANRMESVPSLRVVWTIRDPRDMALSKLYRGQPGNDCATLADDATEAGCVADIRDMFEKLQFAISRFDDRIYLAVMEDMITRPGPRSKWMASFLEIEWHESMPEFWTRMRNLQKAARYKDRDLDQLGLHTRWRKIYGGFFADSHFDIPGVFNELSEITRGLGYD